MLLDQLSTAPAPCMAIQELGVSTGLTPLKPTTLPLNSPPTYRRPVQFTTENHISLQMQ